MSAREYRGIPSIQEVECWGGVLEPDMKVISLTLFRLPGNEVLAHASPLSSECRSVEEFSSCLVHNADTRESRLRILAYDLEEEETREYGCNATSMKSFGQVQTFMWSIAVTARSEYSGRLLLRLVDKNVTKQVCFLKKKSMGLLLCIFRLIVTDSVIG